MKARISNLLKETVKIVLKEFKAYYKVDYNQVEQDIKAIKDPQLREMLPSNIKEVLNLHKQLVRLFDKRDIRFTQKEAEDFNGDPITSVWDYILEEAPYKHSLAEIITEADDLSYEQRTLLSNFFNDNFSRTLKELEEQSRDKLIITDEELDLEESSGNFNYNTFEKDIKAITDPQLREILPSNIKEILALERQIERLFDDHFIIETTKAFEEDVAQVLKKVFAYVLRGNVYKRSVSEIIDNVEYLNKQQQEVLNRLFLSNFGYGIHSLDNQITLKIKLIDELEESTTSFDYSAFEKDIKAIGSRKLKEILPSNIKEILALKRQIDRAYDPKTSEEIKKLIFNKFGKQKLSSIHPSSLNMLAYEYILQKDQHKHSLAEIMSEYLLLDQKQSDKINQLFKKFFNTTVVALSRHIAGLIYN